jgi:hypothetical protein
MTAWQFPSAAILPQTSRVLLKYSRNLDITVEESIRVDTFIVPALLNDEPRIFHGFLAAAISSTITSIDNFCVP